MGPTELPAPPLQQAWVPRTPTGPTTPPAPLQQRQTRMPRRMYTEGPTQGRLPWVRAPPPPPPAPPPPPGRTLLLGHTPAQRLPAPLPREATRGPLPTAGQRRRRAGRREMGSTAASRRRQRRRPTRTGALRSAPTVRSALTVTFAFGRPQHALDQLLSVRTSLRTSLEQKTFLIAPAGSPLRPPASPASTLPPLTCDCCALLRLLPPCRAVRGGRRVASAVLPLYRALPGPHKRTWPTARRRLGACDKLSPPVLSRALHSLIVRPPSRSTAGAAVADAGPAPCGARLRSLHRWRYHVVLLGKVSPRRV